jgi:hypothetical protein
MIFLINGKRKQPMTLKLTRKNASRFILAIVFGGLLFSVGCASTNIKPQGMIPEQIAVFEKHSGSVLLHVDGGSNEHAMQMPVISNEVFLDALETAVKQSNIFQTISDGQNADFRINAFLFNLTQAFFGRAPISLEIAWQLIRLDNGKTLWRESIVTSESGFPSPGDSGSKSYDKTKAIEKAARDNIRLALEHISKVKF